MLNLDMREQQINSEMGTDYHLPVYYFTELLAMAMGATPDQAGLGYHFEPAAQLAQGRIVADTKAEEVTR